MKKNPTTEAATAVLDVSHIRCDYQGMMAVQNLSLHLEKGTIACLLGASGCGKTTTLRAIAGFEPLVAGTIRLNGKVISKPGYRLAPERRQMTMVFQDYALFPHWSIGDNIAAGIRHLSSGKRHQAVHELLQRIGLDTFKDRYPHELSGGQQQRVALARALAPRPGLLLMDEPFSSLDAQLRVQLGQQIRDLLQAQDATCLLVTHDQADAFALSDQVGVMCEGQIRQWGTPYALYHEPVDRFVSQFIGEGSFIKGKLLSPSSAHTVLGKIEGQCHYPWAIDSAVDILIRPDDVVMAPDSPKLGKILRKAFRGAQTLYTVELDDGSRILVQLPSHVDANLGDKLPLRLQADHLVAFEHLN
ncbi:MAG TPA: ABC transporter ATP-binding protein [Gammaproteobacteria bacterium]|mgnify:CR=1 FL=1|nr:ABC transporter ATP-binding protein [Gammaproteobacteria bacterium]